jgi:dienelactone hydrolase
MLREVLNGAAARFDTAMRAAIFHRSARARARSASESLDHDGRVRALASIGDLYDRPEHYAPDAPFFPRPAPIDPQATVVRPLEGGQVVDLRWPSAFEPYCADVAERYMQHVPNRTAAARAYLHHGPARPAVICLHGYRAGHWFVEERAWPVEWLYGKGVDVLIGVLPFHAVRAHRRGAPFFPGSDPRITNEGFRQAMLDVRALVHHLYARGAPAVGVMGMSLGGYTTSLAATVEERLAFAVPIIPLASLATIAHGMGRLIGTPDQQRVQREGLERAHRVVSPLARPARIDRDRILVLAAEGDRITPVEHARRIADHFGAPLEVYHGGHLLHFWRGDAFRSVGRLMGRLGLFG